MIRVSAYPTVEWLKSRACDRGAVRSVPVRRNQSSFSSRIGARLKDVLNENVVVDEHVWISTPNGESELRLVLRNGTKRIAIQISAPYCHAEQDTDAIDLVYGRFEALYRIQSDESNAALHDAIYALMCDRPSWFSNFGRLSVGRYASEEIILDANARREQKAPWISTSKVRMLRMRLCKANDWVASFEKALGAQMQSPAA